MIRQPLPRALCGAVMAMARPRRPEGEARAVREAAAMISTETGLTSARALGKEIANRVTAALLDDAQNDPAAVLPSLASGDPIARLAFDDRYAAGDELAGQFRDRMLAAFGSYIPPIFQQKVQRNEATNLLRKTLISRYIRHINSSYQA